PAEVVREELDVERLVHEDRVGGVVEIEEPRRAEGTVADAELRTGLTGSGLRYQLEASGRRVLDVHEGRERVRAGSRSRRPDVGLGEHRIVPLPVQELHLEDRLLDRPRSCVTLANAAVLPGDTTASSGPERAVDAPSASVANTIPTASVPFRMGAPPR